MMIQVIYDDTWNKRQPPRWKIWWEIVAIEKEKGISNPDQGYPEDPQQVKIDELAKYYKEKFGNT